MGTGVDSRDPEGVTLVAGVLVPELTGAQVNR